MSRKIWRRWFIKQSPDIGGKDNTLASNLDMFLLFLSFYEATDHRMDGEAIDEIIADLYSRLKFLNGMMNINRSWFLRLLRNHLYKSYQKYSDKVAEKRKNGEWLETWGMIVNPPGSMATKISCLICVLWITLMQR